MPTNNIVDCKCSLAKKNKCKNATTNNRKSAKNDIFEGKSYKFSKHKRGGGFRFQQKYKN